MICDPGVNICDVAVYGKSNCLKHIMLSQTTDGLYQTIWNWCAVVNVWYKRIDRTEVSDKIYFNLSRYENSTCECTGAHTLLIGEIYYVHLTQKEALKLNFKW